MVVTSVIHRAALIARTAGRAAGADGAAPGLSTVVDDACPSMYVDDMHSALSPPDVPDADDPEAALAAVLALRRLADRLELAAVNVAIERGWSWAEVAAALGVSRQAAHRRFARRVSPRTP